MSDTIRFDLNADDEKAFAGAKKELGTVRLAASAILTILGVSASVMACSSGGASSEPVGEQRQAVTECRVMACNSPFASCDGVPVGDVVVDAHVQGAAVQTSFTKQFVACNSAFSGKPVAVDPSAKCVAAHLDAFVACNSPFTGQDVPSYTKAVSNCVSVPDSKFVACNSAFSGAPVPPPATGCVLVEPTKFAACNTPFSGVPIKADPSTVGECTNLTCNTPKGSASYVACNTAFGS